MSFGPALSWYFLSFI